LARRLSFYHEENNHKEEEMEIQLNSRSIFNEALNDNFFGNLFTTASSIHQYCPAIDINETKDTFEIVVEVPGVVKEDLKVSIRQNILSVSGKRQIASHEGRRRIVAEIPHGEFSRKFKLPSSVNVDTVTTEYGNGILRITLPKQEHSEAKDIPIQ
jgi:HSP20 family protein